MFPFLCMALSYNTIIIIAVTTQVVPHNQASKSIGPEGGPLLPNNTYLLILQQSVGGCSNQVELSS